MLEKSLVMVGGPFSADTPEIRERNIVATEMLAHAIAVAGGAPMVPNSLGRTYDGKPEYDEWLWITLTALSRSHGFAVTPEWERSSGTRREVTEAFFYGIPVFRVRYAPGFTLPETYNAEVLRRWQETPGYGYDLGALEAWLAQPLEAESRVLSPRDHRRLRMMREAFLPNDPTTVGGNLELVRDGLAAVQSLGDLNLVLGPEANARALQCERTLRTQYDKLLAA